MVSRKLRNKTRRLRGGGCSASKPSATIAPTPLNLVKSAANKIRNNARTARQRNKAEKKDARNAETKLLKKQAEIHAREYANSEVKRQGITGNNSNYRDALYSSYMSAFTNKLIMNSIHGVPDSKGIHDFFDTYGKNEEITQVNMNELNAMMKNANKV